MSPLDPSPPLLTVGDEGEPLGRLEDAVACPVTESSDDLRSRPMLQLSEGLLTPWGAGKRVPEIFHQQKVSNFTVQVNEHL